MNRFPFFWFLTFLLISPVLPAGGDGDTAGPDFAMPGQILDIPLIETPPVIDGHFDTKIYKSFVKMEGFFQVEPKYNQFSSRKTAVYMAYDRDNLYVAFKAYCDDPANIRASYSIRDDLKHNDWIELVIDPFNSRVRGFSFAANPLGVQKDGIFDENIDAIEVDASWDTLYQTAGKIHDWGYCVEMKIPFKSFRFPANTNPQQWGFHLSRWIAANSEVTQYFYYDRQNSSWMSQAGIMRLEENIKPGLHMELVPFITAQQHNEEGTELDGGLNFKYGISSDTTLDVTVNPDFSHIEADEGQIDINRRYALYYPEKRPFFQEGKDMFQTPVEVFYSRRIHSPDVGAKLTGRMGRSSFGIVSALDRRSNRSVWDVQGDHQGERGFFNVLRYRYDIAGQSNIGFTATDKRYGNGFYNSVLGVDSHLRLNKNITSDFQALYSATSQNGTESGHSLYGAVTFVNDHVDASFSALRISPEFDAQAGFVKRTGVKEYNGQFIYKFFPEKSYFKSGGPMVLAGYSDDWQDEAIDRYLHMGFGFSTILNSYLSVFVEKNQERFNGVDFHMNYARLHLFCSPLKWLTFGGSYGGGQRIFYADNPYLGDSRGLSAWFELSPISRFVLTGNWIFDYFYNRDTGETIYKMDIVRLKGEFLFNRRFRLRGIWEYNDYYHQHYGDLLFSYQYNHGTVVYLGYSSARERLEGLWRKKGHTFFLKFSYLFRK
jgi:hypothetical protein